MTAFEEIYRRHYAQMYRLARVMLYDPQESKGVVSNVFARQLRFYFVWNPKVGIAVTLHRLNLFESVNIELNDNKIIVE